MAAAAFRAFGPGGLAARGGLPATVLVPAAWRGALHLPFPDGLSNWNPTTGGAYEPRVSPVPASAFIREQVRAWHVMDNQQLL